MPQTEKVEKVEQLQKSAAPDEPVTGPADSTQPSDAVLGDETSDDSVELRTNKADKIVKNHVIGSTGISLVPIPLVDLIALSGIQLKMLHSLAKLYRVPFSENVGKSLIVSLVGGVMPTSTAMTLASFAKSIPGLGTATGMVSVSVLGGATTYAIGQVFIQHFETGGTLLDFEPKKMRAYFAEKLQEGKQVAVNIRKKNDKAGAGQP